MAAKADCCVTATDDGSALAGSVLLPPALTLPVDEGATGLAASVLLPRAAEGCCGAPAEHAGHAMAAGQACCHHEGKAAAGAACCQDMKDGGCCQETKDGCGMPCCQSMPTTR
jgi:hypothetical protein